MQDEEDSPKTARQLHTTLTKLGVFGAWADRIPNSLTSAALARKLRDSQTRVNRHD